MSSVTNTFRWVLPLWTMKVWPMKSGTTVQARAQVVTGSRAHSRYPRMRISMHQAAHRRVRDKIRARRHRRLDQHSVQVASGDGSPAQPIRIVAGDGGAPGAGDHHSRDRNRPLADSVADSQSIEDGQRAGIERVATELVARKARAIDQAHPDTGTRQHEGRHAAGRPRAHHEDVWEHPLYLARPSTSALFLDPNPRQLQSAASISAGLAVFGMKSMSHAGS